MLCQHEALQVKHNIIFHHEGSITKTRVSDELNQLVNNWLPTAKYW